VLFSSRVRVRLRVRFIACLVSGYAHVFVRVPIVFEWLAISYHYGYIVTCSMSVLHCGFDFNIFMTIKLSSEVAALTASSFIV